MGISEDERRRAFSVWLRTGRLPRARGIEGVEHKFNPWHDPQTGRFTFAGTGRYFGRWGGGGFTGGGGGSFRGGGATGTDQWPDPRAKPKAPQRKPPTPARRAVFTIPMRAPAPPSRPATSAPEFRRLVRNGYEYQIDTSQRTRRVSGAITLTDPQPRSRAMQARAGGGDRRSSDDGGHYIARRFNGPTDAFNHFAQDASFNRGRYRALEDEWAKAKRGGKEVSVTIVPWYVGSSQRPSEIDVRFVIDGNRKSLKFPNERKEVSHGKR